MFKKIWKTFCNTDVIGKIYMLIIFFIVIVSIITVIVRYTIVGKKEEQQVNEDVIDVIEKYSLIFCEAVVFLSLLEYTMINDTDGGNFPCAI